MLGTIEEVVDELRDQGRRVGALAIKSFRPFPLEEVRAALAGARRVIVLEKALAVGIGGIVAANVRMALSGIDLDGHTVIAGLGGRPDHAGLAAAACSTGRRRGSSARSPSSTSTPSSSAASSSGCAPARRAARTPESMLRDVGIVAARPH